MHFTMYTLMLQGVPDRFCLQIEGMNELSTKIYDGVPREMKVEVKPFFSLFNSHSYGALIGYAW